VLRAVLSASGYLPLLRLLRTGLSLCRDSNESKKRRLEIAEIFNFSLTCRIDSDNLEKFAQKRHSLLSGSRKSKLSSSKMLRLAPDD
jgi:hypothetical protein